MASLVKWAGVGCLAVAATLAWHAGTIEAAEPVVYSVLEGQDTGSGDVSIVVVGSKVSKFKQFDLRDGTDASVAVPTQTLRSKSLIVLTVPGTVDAGAYTLVMTTAGRKAASQSFTVNVTKGGVVAGSVVDGSLGTTLRDDLDDAVTVGGFAPTAFVDVTGTQVIGGMKTFDETVTSDVADGNAVVGRTNATTGLTYGVLGQSASDNGRGVRGVATSTTGFGFGVEGQSRSGDGIGVFGYNTAQTGDAVGVQGYTSSPTGRAVNGIALATTGSNQGVHGETYSDSGFGVVGVANSTTGSGVGVQGGSNGPNGTGVVGINGAITGSGWGVYGLTNSTTGSGIYGESASTTGTTYGVRGRVQSNFGAGVYGESATTSGSTAGVKGSAASTTGYGVYGESTATAGSTAGVAGSAASTLGYGVYGFHYGTTGDSIGVLGASDGSPNGIGVFGTAGATSGTNYGVYGRSFSDSGRGVNGQAFATTGFGIGVFGETRSSQGVGVLGAVNTTSGNPTALRAQSVGDGNALVAQMYGNNSSAASSTTARNVAIFQANPTGVQGTGSLANCARIDRDGKGFFNGGTASSGADFAESVDVEGDAATYEPGDVMVVSLHGDRRFALSTAPQSTLVAGVYSTKPAVLGSAHPDVAGTDGYAAGEIPLGVVGIVPTKVCDENGPIRRGDLLVTSSVPGHAMRAPADARPGTIVGKALGELEAGTGKIEILLSLQ